MSDERVAWKSVSTGLSLKLVALVLLLLMPLVNLAAPGWNMSPSAALTVVVVLAVGVDLAGRGLCLAAPFSQRTDLVASIVCQLAGAVAFGTGWFFAGAIERSIGLMTALCCQAFAALLFVRYLEGLCRERALVELLVGVQRLRRRLIWSIATTAWLVAIVILVAATILAIALFTYGLGVFLAIPAGLLLFPLVVFTAVVFSTMIWCYATVMIRLTRELQLKCS